MLWFELLSFKLLTTHLKLSVLWPNVKSPSGENWASSHYTPQTIIENKLCTKFICVNPNKLILSSYLFWTSTNVCTKIFRRNFFINSIYNFFSISFNKIVTFIFILWGKIRTNWFNCFQYLFLNKQIMVTDSISWICSSVWTTTLTNICKAYWIKT